MVCETQISLFICVMRTVKKEAKSVERKKHSEIQLKKKEEEREIKLKNVTDES